MGQPDYEAELIAVAKPFWNAEAEITRRFFAGKPSREHYLRYLKAAVYKELNPVIATARRRATPMACTWSWRRSSIASMGSIATSRGATC